MPWENKVLKVLSEYHNKEGELKSKWEIIQPTNEETGKHFAPAIQKTSFYMKDGELRRGYAQALTQYDLNWVRENWARIREALDPAPPMDAPKAAQPTETPQTDADIQEVPF